MRLDVNIRLPDVINPIRSSFKDFVIKQRTLTKCILRVRSVKRGFIGINLVQRRMMMLTNEREGRESSQNSSVGHRRCHNRRRLGRFPCSTVGWRFHGPTPTAPTPLRLERTRERLRHFQDCRAKNIPLEKKTSLSRIVPVP